MLNSRVLSEIFKWPLLAVFFAISVGFGELIASTWSVVESGTTDQFETVVWHKGRFIAASGWSGSVIGSEEGLIWRPFTTGNPSFGSNVIVAGDAIFSMDYPMKVSFEGTTWTNTNIGNERPLGIAIGAGRYVAVGDGGKLWSSMNAVDWEPNTQGVTSSTLEAVQYGNGTFVAVGWSGTVVRSVDGRSWEVGNISARFGGFMRFLIWNGTKFRAVSNGYEAFESADGRNWKFLWSMPFSTRKIVFARGQYLAVSSSGEAWESPDMKNWKKAELNSNAYIGDVTYGEGRFVLVGANGLIRVRTLPTVVDQPQSMVVPLGGRIELNASGVAEGSFGLQWRKDGRNLSGKTSSSLVIDAAELKDGGRYSVRLSSSGGADVSQTASVGVVDTSPRTVVGALGRTVTFSIRSGGVVENVAWDFLDGAVSTPVIDGAGLSGGTTKTITIRNVGLNHGGDYSWSVGGVDGGPIRLLVATKKPDYAPEEITLEPTIVGAAYDFSVPLPNDLAGAPSTFRASGLPAGISLDAVTGRLFGRPTSPSKELDGHLVRLTLSNAFGSYVVALRLRVEPLPAGVVGQFNGIVERGSELGGDSGGRIDMTVTNSGSYSGSMRLGARLIRIKGALNVDVSGADLPKGEFAVTPTVQNLPSIISEFEVDGDANALRGWVKGGLSEPSYSAFRNIWNSANRAEGYGGYYTMALPLDTQDPGSVLVPQGTGFATLRVNEVSGRAQISGRLSDDTAITCAGFASPSGEVPHYWVGYNYAAARGTVLGMLSLSAGGTPFGSQIVASGIWTWTRPEDPSAKARVYREGFGPLALNVSGGKYSPPGRTEVVMGLPVESANPPGNAVLSFDKTVGDDAVAVDPDISILIKPGGGVVLPVAALNPRRTTLKLSVSTGLFSGSHLTRDDNPRPPPAVPRVVERRALYYGVIVNDGSAVGGVGYFLRTALPSATLQDTPQTSPIYSGRVWLE
jgi:hypothetical protein